MNEDTTNCPMCGCVNGPSSLLGALGELIHYRCQDCGWVYEAINVYSEAA